jgi:hypothetical protein
MFSPVFGPNKERSQSKNGGKVNKTQNKQEKAPPPLAPKKL